MAPVGLENYNAHLFYENSVFMQTRNSSGNFFGDWFDRVADAEKRQQVAFPEHAEMQNA